MLIGSYHLLSCSNPIVARTLQATLICFSSLSDIEIYFEIMANAVTFFGGDSVKHIKVVLKFGPNLNTHMFKAVVDFSHHSFCVV